jgi:hypothetical protein
MFPPRHHEKTTGLSWYLSDAAHSTSGKMQINDLTKHAADSTHIDKQGR